MKKSLQDYLKYDDWLLSSDTQDFQKKMETYLLFHQIVSVNQIDEQTAELILDNGVKLTSKGHKGCGSCYHGWCYLKDLNDCPNAITKVECIKHEDNSSGETFYTYEIFVYAEDRRINCLKYEGWDNGYYGMGYRIEVDTEGYDIDTVLDQEYEELIR